MDWQFPRIRGEIDGFKKPYVLPWAEPIDFVGFTRRDRSLLAFDSCVFNP